MGLSLYKPCCPSSVPDPKRFRIIRSQIIGETFIVLEVQYHGCTNYEGRKILVYDTPYPNQVLLASTLDPHFNNAAGRLSPVARFEPTDRGWQDACDYAEMCSM